MIEEDYVSVETSRLLNEKGFDSDECEVHYDPYDHQEYEITLQMARKWLREKHHLHIEIRITNNSISGMVNIVKYYWVMCDTETGRWCDESTVYTVKVFDKSEQAEEDAIRHALEKLD